MDMKGKTLTPGESQEPTEYEKVIEGLAKILQLTYIMSIGEVAHPTRKRMEPVTVSPNNDFKEPVTVSPNNYFKVLFSKHWNEFKDKYPRADLQNFKASQRKRIQSILDEILEKIPSFEHDERYFDAGKYINEYLSQEVEKKREDLKEPHAMVKAWVICFERLGNNEKLTDMQAIDKYTDIFKWGGSKEVLRQKVSKAGMIRGSDGKKGNLSEKQIRDLGSAIKYMNNKEAIAKAKETYSKLQLL